MKSGVADGITFQPFIPDGMIDPFADIDKGSGDIVPSQYLLASAYPNPFNPETVISYQLPVVSHVNLAVYDLSGRRVAQLINGWREAGYHEVTFDGIGLASGVYIYHLTAGQFTATGKMVLVR